MKINIINACSDLGVNVDGSRYSPIKVKEYLKNNEKSACVQAEFFL